MFAVVNVRELIRERLTAAAEEILGVFEQTISVYEEEINRQRTLLDLVLKPDLKLHRTELPRQYVSKEEEVVLADQQLCNLERDSSLDQETPQIKEEQGDCANTSQEGEQLVLKQEDDFLNSDRSDRRDQSQDWTLVYSDDQSQSAAEEEPPDNVSGKRVRSESDRRGSGVSEPNSEDQLLFEKGDRGKAAKPKRKLRGTSTSTRNIKAKRKKTQNDRGHKKQSGKNSKSTSNSQPKPTQLKSHMRTRTAEKPFSCTVCGKRFGFKRYLKQHMITHSGEKPYSCNTCWKGFRRLEHLQIHMRSHTGERPYSCVYCERAFSVSSTLTKHIRLHTGEKPYN
ncbi:zinc finger protein with KRAB and SCAN domains 8-like [Toxotes jaculatrix]|uniref:zinc finger protein with KRAB and SCAN domains 8-like n=1 Tax=Toxotes jaculatrix TaxID=941984 RepID=UPI001B3ACEE5|nr:zinc finger protein with KRAB and SCAN domains 8-like [Toxotes jaculatrix]